MKTLLSGYAGCGKSTIISLIKEKFPEVFVFPESAREVEKTELFYDIPDKDGHFFQKSVMNNEIMKINLAHMNKIKNAVFDRSIIDNFSFAALFYSMDRVKKDHLKRFVDDFKEQYGVDRIYDRTVFITISDDLSYIKENILNDLFRVKTTTNEAQKWHDLGKRWEDYYLSLYEEMKLSNHLNIIQHFTKNDNFSYDIRSILENDFIERKPAKNALIKP